MDQWTLNDLKPPHLPPLHRQDVHLWVARVDAHLHNLAHLHTLLAPAEQARAARFYFEPDRQLYIVAHSLLRALLSAYLHTPPQMLQFARTSYGKPVLVQQERTDPSPAEPCREACKEERQALTFNLSHSGRHVLLGLARFRAIGVDVEAHKPLDRLDDLIRHFFSPQEQARILPQSPTQRLDSFYRTWTRKEAFIKAIGEGLSHPTQTFSVPTGPVARMDDATPPPRLPIELAQGTTPHWSLYDCTVDDAYPSALVVQTGAHTVDERHAGQSLHIEHMGRLV